ncbi:hypothetical protein KUTeg_008946 [Tegillarca granosa]|uniref:Uncharacterized protein n=1 Tax=Tegillarca granosa TaxID=220873 RepID=A0ABQ9FFE0_TEGGR|nr:hypothetical protein KUTeg_008946 [Tegillarca granosa]
MRQDNTVRQYMYGFQKFKKWTDMFQEHCALPAQPLHASLYLLSIMQSSDTCSPVISAFYSISWAHKLAGYVDRWMFCQNLLEAMCLIAFSGFFRFAELCCIKEHIIVFEPSYVKIVVEKSKNDVYRDEVPVNYLILDTERLC